MDVETILSAYVECALWSSTDESDENGGLPMDQNYGREDLAPETLASMRADVESFLVAVPLRSALDFWEYDLGAAQIGHDFWLTRNGHGAGFWDRFSGNTPGAMFGRILTDAAKPYGESSLYVGDDGRIYT